MVDHRPLWQWKSSFALFLAHLLQKNANALNKLTDTDPALTYKIECANTGVYCPVLVVGSREPLSLALLRGLIHGTDAFLASLARHQGKPRKKLKDCRDELRGILQEAKAIASSDISDEIVVDLYQRTAAAVHTATSGGLLLIIDELGKLLEYAPCTPTVATSMCFKAWRNGTHEQATHREQPHHYSSFQFFIVSASKSRPWI